MNSISAITSIGTNSFTFENPGYPDPYNPICIFYHSINIQ